MLFDTAEIPWWAWVRRFHLPEAEKLNGRAAMMGYVLALFVDQLTGARRGGALGAPATSKAPACCPAPGAVLPSPISAPTTPPPLCPAAGVGLLDQQNSFIGKVLLHVCVFAILLVRTTSDLDKYKNLIDEVGGRAAWQARCARRHGQGREPCSAARAA